jgi:uncharacterized protein (UPF0276 family)
VGLTKAGPRFGIALGTKDHEPILENEALRPDWVEVGTDAFLGARGGQFLNELDRVRRELPVALHGTSLSVGSVDPLDGGYLQSLKSLIDRAEPVYVSDHLAWSSFGGRPLELLPLPYTEEALAHVIGRVQQVQEALGRQILLENPSSYLAFADSTMAEWEFLAEVSKVADCGILLDVNNAYVSGYNNGFDPIDYVRGLPADRVGQIHLAGHRDMGGFLLDTHEGPVPEGVWAVYREAIRRFEEVPVILEWGLNAPSLEDRLAECRRAAMRHGEASS